MPTLWASTPVRTPLQQLFGLLRANWSWCAVVSGSGIYVDNVLTAENKANTNALDVRFISYIPLISPLVDISNQAAVRFPVS